MELVQLPHSYVMAKCIHTVHGKLLAGKKLANLGNRELFTKIFLTNIH